ncbi:MAG TPA: DNA alkylation repair protein [Beutenbergiaceae bacterium]|nr:DNA alkylation repair protein [Beutenbergiaceae bacterium]
MRETAQVAGGADDDLIGAIRAGLAAAGDPERAAGQQRYMKSTMPFHGVRMGQVRRIVRAAVARHPLENGTQWEATIRELWDDAARREERYAATALARHPSARAYRTPEVLDLYRHLVTGAWWDHVDEIAAHLVGEVLRFEPDAVEPVLRGWAEGEDMWLRRTAILAQLRSKDGTDTALLAHCLSTNLEGSRFGSEFFIRKAVGWALREYAKTDPDWVRRFVAEHCERLSGLSVREASKHLPLS